MNHINKENLKNLFIKYLDFIKFCFVGVSNTIISLIIYWILLKLNVNYLFASTIGYLVGIFNGYIFSSKFVFKKSKGVETIIKFFMVYASSLLINLAILYLLVDKCLFNKLIAQVFAIGFNTIYNFILNKIWTFKG